MLFGCSDVPRETALAFKDVGGDGRPGRDGSGLHNSSTDRGWSLCGWEGGFQMNLEKLSISLLTS